MFQEIFIYAKPYLFFLILIPFIFEMMFLKMPKLDEWLKKGFNLKWPLVACTSIFACYAFGVGDIIKLFGFDPPMPTAAHHLERIFTGLMVSFGLPGLRAFIEKGAQGFKIVEKLKKALNAISEVKKEAKSA